MKLNKSKKDKDLYWYKNNKNEKMWMYRYKYYDDLGKRKEKKKSGFTSEDAGLKALLKVKADLLNGQVKKVERDQLTVSKWLDLWYETNHAGWGVTTKLQRANAIKYQMKPLLGSYLLQELDRTTYIRAYINVLLKQGYEISTVKLFHRLFKVAINAAVDDEILTRNRFNKVPFEKEKELDNFLTPSELSLFLDITKKYENITNYTFVLLLSYTGLRKGEALGLKWQNIDLKNNTLTVDCTRDRFGERSPKTKNSYRTIPIDESLIKQLKIYRKWCMETKLKYGMKLDKKKDHLFISYQGGTPMSATTSKYLFDRIYKAIEKEKLNIKTISAHGLRHTHATILISEKVPVNTIADRLGNTPEMIYTVYAHNFKQLEDGAVQAFGQSLNGAKIGAN